MSDTIEVQSTGAPNGWGGYHWETPESVVAVPTKEALQILRIPHGGFFQAEPYEARPAKKLPGRPKKESTEETVPPVESASPINSLSTALNLVTPKGD